MFTIIIGNFLHAVADVLNMALTIYMWIIIARAVLSWVNPDPYNPIVRIINQITDPVLFRVRRHVPAVFGGIDFTPIIVLLAIYFVQAFFVQSLKDLAVKLTM
ncbi:MAG: YggT family protein [Desulfobacteraceae bacterium]|nr:YggT family protein [Desulfobacteraceae bacterium]